jgi:hypothetical protein
MRQPLAVEDLDDLSATHRLTKCEQSFAVQLMVLLKEESSLKRRKNRAKEKKK